MPRNKWFFLALLWFIIGIYALIFRENSHHTPPPFPHFDKLSHGLLFLVQFWLLSKAYMLHQRPLKTWLLLLLALLYATLSELGQLFLTQTRSADWLDGLADIIGASIGIHLAQIWHQSKNKF